jgi:putative peptidoglycan lipid II flippase
MPSLSPQVKKVLTLMVPGIIGASVMQINIFIDMFLASFLPPTAITYLHYADRLNQLPLSIFGIAIGTALLPLLSKQIRSNHKQAATHTAKSALELSLQLTAPSTLGLIVLCYPIIKLIYGHGCFNDNDVLNTAPTLAAFACGLPAYVMGKVLQTCFFAEQDTKTPLYVALGTILLNLILNLILIRFFEHVGLALSTALASWFNVIVMAIILSKRDHFHFFTQSFIFYSLKVIFAAFVMGGFLMVFQQMVHFPDHLFLQMCYIGLEIIVGGIIFLLQCYFLKTLTLLKYLKTKKS